MDKNQSEQKAEDIQPRHRFNEAILFDGVDRQFPKMETELGRHPVTGPVHEKLRH